MKQLLENFEQVILVIGLFGWYYIEELPDKRKNTRLYLLICGLIFFIIAHYVWGLANTVVWYVYYMILLFIIYAIIVIFSNIKKRFIQHIINKVNENNK